MSGAIPRKKQKLGNLNTLMCMRKIKFRATKFQDVVLDNGSLYMVN